MPSNLLFLIVFLGSTLLSFLLSKLVIPIAQKYKILDYPKSDRKIHKEPIALLGGLGIYASFLLSILSLWFFSYLNDSRISMETISYFMLAGLVLMFNGFLDDKYDLKAKYSIWGPIIASILVIYSGLKISYITNIDGSVLYLDNFIGNIFNIDSGYWLAILITFVWLMGITYTTKLLDGIDGLVSSIGLVASIVIFVVSLSWDIAGSATTLMSLALAGSLLGFLFLNWYPAKIFLGEGGSTFIGFSLGVLSIISGSKIATALLVMGLPVLDILWVIVRRLKNGQAIWHGDKYHLHFRLLDAGFSQRKIVLFLTSVSVSFGIISIFFTTKEKIGALILLFLLMVLISSWLSYKLKQKHEQN